MYGASIRAEARGRMPKAAWGPWRG